MLDAARGDFKSNPILYYDTMLRYYLHVDTDALHDEEWAQTIKQLEDIRKRESG